MNTDYHKECNPYLNAPRGRKIWYKSCSWNREDAFWSKCIVIGGVGLLFILATYLTMWLIGG
jgi:hypothetical protein